MHIQCLPLFVLFIYGCEADSIGQRNSTATERQIVNAVGSTLKERIRPPAGYQRITLVEHSFAHYLRYIPLQPDGSSVHYYDGRLKPNDVHAAVIKMDVGNKDLQQCADAIMRLRAEYLFHGGRADDIHFNFTNGFRADYSKWREGYRVAIDGNSAGWVKSAIADPGYASFRKYLGKVFTYAGTLSLSKELKTIAYKDLQPGDIFIRGGSPGHAVIVMDVAVNGSGKKVYLLAQSYMPAQEIHLLKNFNDPGLSPWYALEPQADIRTPEWTFTVNDLKRFPD